MSVELSHAAEVGRGERFEFGKNWSRFLTKLTDDRILQAEESLKSMLEVDDLRGKRFLDIGSGSGLFSLAARRLGATVHSFDYDTHSVACTTELRQRYFPDSQQWVVEQGSALDSVVLAMSSSSHRKRPRTVPGSPGSSGFLPRFASHT
jgi:SAM-dependent methyltransferase